MCTESRFKAIFGLETKQLEEETFRQKAKDKLSEIRADAQERRGLFNKYPTVYNAAMRYELANRLYNEARGLLEIFCPQLLRYPRE